ncbi:ATP-binding cassette, subfamily B [Haladaptatus litoreus]|uniref:ATP-binding cassette, subfamily B n=1 Tax=Haladaptatus litoreus TaxID=553468 RepID=A0A1N7F1I6_9EURY|nr:ABC transporter ATP-binding protein [Haladaptatus litoreus]SIR94154.1 ATP-binding cassette, subfamily B [Haladaptatus litoreus]
MTDKISERAETNPLVSLVRRYGRGDLPFLLGAIASTAVSIFLSLADVYLIGLGIDALFNDQQFILPLLPQSWVPTDPIALLVFVTGLLVATNLVTNLLSFVGEYSFGLYAQRFLHEVRTSAFATVISYNLAFFDDHRTGDVISALNDDVNQLDTFFNKLIEASIWAVVTLGSAFVYMAVLNVQLALFVLLSAPVIAGINWWFSQQVEPLQDNIRTERGALNALLEVALDGIDVIKANTAETAEHERIHRASHDYTDARFANRRLSIRQSPINRLVVGIWLVFVVAIGIQWITVGPPLIFSGTLTAGELVPFLFYLERMTAPMKNLSGLINGYKAAKAAAKRVSGLTAREARTGRENGQWVGFDAPSVLFDHVSFDYPGTKQQVIEGVDLVVEPGTTVGIVGGTGAGKSTLLDLLLRYRDPDEGTITIDGHDLQTVAPESLRRQVGYVDQESFLFDGTVRENIAAGSADGDVSDEAICEAASGAGAQEFITALPEGYDTELGHQGTNLSGGQRQRLAIARAIVDNPALLVFDEATSHVDTETERVVQKHLAEITANRTTFVVAHRLSTVRHADQIIVMEDGKIVERGTHSDLVRRGGQYATLWNIQTGAVEAAGD